jgi:hypothetical protein
MKKLTILMAGLSVAVAAVPSIANAAPYQNINQRQTNLFQRIEQGVRSGALTRGEAQRLRTDFRSLNNLEARYRNNGLSNWERTDLNRRYDALASRVRYEKRDRQDRRNR